MQQRVRTERAVVMVVLDVNLLAVGNRVNLKTGRAQGAAIPAAARPDFQYARIWKSAQARDQ